MWISLCSVWDALLVVRGLEKEGARSEQISLLLPTANATLRAQGTPPVQSVIFSATKEVQGVVLDLCGRAGLEPSDHSRSGDWGLAETPSSC